MSVSRQKGTSRGEGPVVDIVITNHNYGRFLETALNSACGQSYGRINVIAVDDGSTDDSRAILNRYDGEVDVVFKDRGGQASALNAGIERCDGDILLTLDADDVLRPHAAERVAEAFAADPDLAKVQFRMAVIDAAGGPTGATKPTSHLVAPSGDMRRAELAFPFDIPWLPGGGTAFRMDAVRRILPIPESDYPRCGADWYLVHLSALLGTAAAIDDVCAEYRAHGDNAYEMDRTDLDLGHVRDSIAYASATTVHLSALAREVAIAHSEPILSVADLANRLVSVKLEPDLHPIDGDRPWALARQSVRAVGRRFDVAWPMKAMFVSWFGVMAIVPRGLARRLAELFLFPERRRFANRLLGRLHLNGQGSQLKDSA
jgi:glycosyltransferase involved in cell wall biosynthesis